MNTETALDSYGHLMMDECLKFRGGCECRKHSGVPFYSSNVKLLKEGIWGF